MSIREPNLAFFGRGAKSMPGYAQEKVVFLMEPLEFFFKIGNELR
jgi:hypothetical protein